VERAALGEFASPDLPENVQGFAAQTGQLPGEGVVYVHRDGQFQVPKQTEYRVVALLSILLTTSGSWVGGW
jgi:hypothetical protein